jgi:formylglycine-generating enzyme required for sulfatase activity
VEWEKAARGQEGYLYPWGNEWDSTRGHFSRDDGWGKVAAVDAFPSGASPYGVMDMMGNTYEWTHSNVVDTNYFASGELVVCRGCSWEIAEMPLPAWFAGRVTNQTFNPMYGLGLDHVGLRPIRDKWYLTIFPATVAPSTSA